MSINSYLQDKKSFYRINWVAHLIKDKKLHAMEGTVISVIPDFLSEADQILHVFYSFLTTLQVREYRKMCPPYFKALELALLRGLAHSMGQEAIEIFYERYLPQLDEQPDIHDIFQKMCNLDDRGLLQTIFIKELMFLPVDGKDYSEELAGLTEYLTIPTSECYLNGKIRLALYNSGSYEQSEISRVCCDRVYFSHLTNRGRSVRVVPSVMSEAEKRVFYRKVKENHLEPGKMVYGWVLKTSPDVVLLDLDGMQGILLKEEFGWHRLQRQDNFCNGDFCHLKVEEIDYKLCRIYLSNKKDLMNPKKTLGFPEVYTVVRVLVVREFHTYLLGLYRGIFEVVIPKRELPARDRQFPGVLIGSTVSVLIYHIDAKSRIYGSIRKTVLNRDKQEIPDTHAQGFQKKL